jgi:hemoglobin
MRKLILTAALAFGMAVVPATAMAKPMHAKHAMAKEKSLYERLGGAPAVSAVIDDFAGRVLADTRINAKFAKSDPTRLVTNLKTFVTQATGGPKVYKGQTMAAAHHNMGVTDAEFGALVEDLVATLDKFNVPAKEKGELLAALGPLGPQIVSVHSNETGGALPASFKPAPAAKK